MNSAGQISDDAWFMLLVQSYASPPVYLDAHVLPAFPADAVQRATTGQCGAETLLEAFIFYQDCLNVLAEFGRPLRPCDSVLDFGTGWGRIARCFMRETHPQNIFGIDVTADLIDFCKKAFRSNNFIVNQPLPPTPIPDKRFNFIVGYSVFSHLSEVACDAWMDEFHRILAPGGIVALTTRGRPFLDVCESLKGTDASGYSKAMSMIFGDFEDARERYDRGEFLHSNIAGVSGGGAMNSSFYGETLIPESYARTRYENNFDLIKFLFEPPRQAHPIMFFRKKE